ncbi:capsule assembly Wzi family protein [Amylibacter sp.]|nr:capsule assembly Wzi family protein [Amylibacter sp.]
MSNTEKENQNINHKFNSLSSKIALNFDKHNNLTFDGSYIEYTHGITTLGFGSIDRQWSLSNNTSLILSHNARALKSIYLKLDNKIEYKWLPYIPSWSFEIFNGFTEGSLNGRKSMLLGMRAILSPNERLNIELVQTSQWGGDGYSNGRSALASALIFDTNNSKNSNINKMAGFGISYTMQGNIIPLRIYGQAIGEDEAGNLPSCYAYLAGLEVKAAKIKYPTIVSIEAIDTRVDKTSNGYCGPNTMYNNSIYNYSNYGKAMGAEIDTEGTSLGLHIRSQISQEINIDFTTKAVVINDNNWHDHRLSSKRQKGLINMLGVTWTKNNINLNGSIYNQGFSLDKASIKNGHGISVSSTIKF